MAIEYNAPMLAQLIKAFSGNSSKGDDKKSTLVQVTTSSSLSSSESSAFSETKVQKEPMFHGYAILCEENKVYVGRIDAGTDKTIEDRYHEHEMGVGSEWTRKYRPVRLLAKEMNQDKWGEDNMLFRYMEKYRKENVRGGSYSQMELTKPQCYALDKKFKSINDACFTCGSIEHFANVCPDKDKPRPKRDDADSSDYKATRKGRKTTASKPYTKSKTGPNIKKLVCFRCGRSTHMAYNCKNSTTIDRTKLHQYSKWEYKPKETN